MDWEPIIKSMTALMIAALLIGSLVSVGFLYDQRSLTSLCNSF
jgi:hypothetical protein